MKISYEWCGENFYFQQSSSEIEREMKIKSKEARKYIFNCLDDMAQVNPPNSLIGNEQLAEKIDRYVIVALPSMCNVQWW